ncbi:MAG TPA: bifunctional [glutamate--ammonia ligase]-adenylyl-L-tyrosine phosphorylase/[glutamate--ammonia-ligase] adenylyltransferase, partial [Polyangiaceae bacterium]
MIWRVDLRLRPEGSRGPLVNSLAAAERYYETWGRLWERAALLRARPIAGDLEFGRAVLREVFTPFVYRREVDPEIATALAELVQRSRAELSKAPERDLKLGPGGIREAEFFIQSLQLIWGGQERTLRVPSSLSALERLESRGLVSDGEAGRLRQAYLLLRTLEHYVQYASGVQTHLLPEREAGLERMARALSFPGEGALLDALERARNDVSELFVSILPSAPRPPSRYQELLGRLDDPDADLPAYARRQIGNPDAGEHLSALARRPDGLLGSATRERFRDIADEVLDAVAESADAEQAARYLMMFFARFLSPAPYVSAFGEDRRALKRLISVLGASVFAAEAFVHSPDLVDSVLFGGGGSTDPTLLIDTLFAEARRMANPSGDPYEWRQTVQTALRRAKQRVMVEVAVMDLAGEIGTREVTRRLAALADEEIERALRFELPEATGLSVIAVGKLGGQDIGYASDLDVLFIFDPEAAPADTDPAEYYVRRAQRVIRLISEPNPAGPGYELDTRLRPSGKSGLLVASLASFARYHGVSLESVPRDSGPAVLSSGAAWERQALLRARVCAGDSALGQRALEVAETAAYARGAPAVSEMHHLRMRMERELARERPGYFDLKTGRGGLLDVEFAVQWLQMRHGADRRVRTPDTATALAALRKGNYVSLSHFQALDAGYKFLRRLEQRIVVLNGSGNTVVTRELPGLAQLARRMGLED